jgi:hypothetical protein
MMMTAHLLLFLFLTTLPVLAHGEDSSHYNPPGWVGGTLAIVAIVLPALVLVWRRFR